MKVKDCHESKMQSVIAQLPEIMTKCIICRDALKSENLKNCVLRSPLGLATFSQGPLGRTGDEIPLNPASVYPLNGSCRRSFVLARLFGWVQRRCTFECKPAIQSYPYANRPKASKICITSG